MREGSGWNVEWETVVVCRRLGYFSRGAVKLYRFRINSYCYSGESRVPCKFVDKQPNNFTNTIINTQT